MARSNSFEVDGSNNAVSPSVVRLIDIGTLALSEEPKGHLVWLLSLAQIVSWGALYYSFALVSDAMQRDVGLDKVTLNGAWSIALLLTGLCGFPVGTILDRIGGRTVMTSGSLIGVLSLALWSKVNDAPTMYLVCVGLGIGMSACLYEAGFAVLTQRFPKTFRNQIVRMSLVAGLTPTIFIPVTAFLISHFGWRHALQLLSLAVLFTSLPIHFIFLKTGSKLTRHSYRSNAAASNQALRQAIQRPTFWLLLVSFTLYSVLVSSILFHIIPLLRERNVAEYTITLAYMSIGPAQVIGRVGLMFLQRFVKMTVAGILTFLMLPVGLIALLVYPPKAIVVFFVLIAYGVGNGLYTIVRGTAVPDLLGLEGYGAINGAHTLAIRIGGALGPYSVALAWNALQSYDLIIWGFLVLSLLSALSYAAAVFTAKDGLT